jgi:hypothetical protein
VNRRTAIASIVLIAVVAFTVVLAGSLQVQAKRAAGVRVSTASDPACLTPTPGGLESWIILGGLERPVNGIASRYVVTNETFEQATTFHSYCDVDQNLVGTDSGTIPADEGRVYDLGATGAVSEGYAGYAIVSSDKLITGAVLPLEYDLGVELGPDHTQRAAPGQTLLYDHMLTNTGTTTDTDWVEVLSSQQWPVQLLSEARVASTDALTLELRAQMSASLQVRLTVPSGAAGITDMTVITATSQLSPTVQDTATDTTVVAHTVYLPLTMKRWPPVPSASHLSPIDNADQDNSYTVSWQQANLATTYVLQEATNASFSDARVVYQGYALSWSAPSPGKTPSTYYYRVKARNSWADSPWSNVQAVEVYPLFVGLELRWDGEGYIRGDYDNFDVGVHTERNCNGLTDPDTIRCHSDQWYDPNPEGWESESWDDYYSVSTGHFRSSSVPSDPSWKWGNPWILPYEWSFHNGQTFSLFGQDFLVSGPHTGYTAFGQAVQYWKLVNKDRFLHWDGGGDWKAYVRAGDATLHYHAGSTRLLLHRDLRRTGYYKGDRTNETVQYITNLTSANVFATEATSVSSDYLALDLLKLPHSPGAGDIAPAESGVQGGAWMTPENDSLVAPEQLPPAIMP